MSLVVWGERRRSDQETPYRTPRVAKPSLCWRDVQVPCHLPVSLCATSASRETQYREHRWRGFVSREGSTFSNARNWFSQVASLEDEALGLLPLLSGGESGTSGVLKHFPDTLVGLGRALNVLLGTNLVLDLSCLWMGQYAG